jgi:hypothetical protein
MTVKLSIVERATLDSIRHGAALLGISDCFEWNPDRTLYCIVYSHDDRQKVRLILIALACVSFAADDAIGRLPPLEKGQTEIISLNVCLRLSEMSDEIRRGMHPDDQNNCSPEALAAEAKKLFARFRPILRADAAGKRPARRPRKDQPLTAGA